MTATLLFHANAYQPGIRHHAHSHDELHLSLVLGGHLVETVGTTTEHASALSVVAKDSGVVHADHFGSGGARLAKLTLPSGTIAGLIDDPSRSSGWRWTHSAVVARPFLRLVNRAGNGASSFRTDDPDVLDLLAAFTARPAARVGGDPPIWLEETVSELRSSWQPGTRVADVAQRAGVHPVYLARCFRRWLGIGVSEELRRLRLHWAAAAIANGSRSVSEVAHASGFSDEPHLCREFQRAAGTTPGRYRALLRALDYDPPRLLRNS